MRSAPQRVILRRQILLSGPSSGSPCYSARLRNNDGETEDIIAEKLSREQIIITKAGERPKVPSIFI
jgi:hypothetical protein